MTEQEQFETTYLANDPNLAAKNSMGGYVSAATHYAWGGWQAARATAEQSEPATVPYSLYVAGCRDFERVAARCDDAAEIIGALQKALAYWMPTVFDERSARDAYLLMGYNGEDEPSYWDAKSQQDAAIPFRPHHEILDALKTDPKLLADIEKSVAASKESIAQLERERTVTREQLNTPLCQAAGDYDVEALMDRWGIPSHLRDRFRVPMRKLVVCKKQDAAVESQRSGDGS